MKQKRFFTDSMDKLFERKWAEGIYWTAWVCMMLVLFFVFYAILDGRLQKKLPEKQKQFETNYETIYEPKYEVLENALQDAMKGEEGFNVFALQDVEYHLAFEGDALVVTVELPEEDAAYPIKITAKITDDRQILSKESEKLSKEEYVNSNIQILNGKLGTNSLFLSLGVFLGCNIVFLGLWGLSILHKNRYQRHHYYILGD